MLARVLQWMSRRSLATLHSWGKVLGWLGYLLSPSYRRRFAGNAKRAGLSREDWHPAIAQAGCMVMELPYLWLRPHEQTLGARVEWHGAGLMDAALDEAQTSGSGLVLLTPHVGAFEVNAQAYAERWGGRSPMTVLYRRSRQPRLRELVDAARARPHLATAPASLAGVRQMMRALRRGEVVGLLPDQVPPEGMGVWAPFFGVPAYTMTLAARLAQHSGARILLMCCQRAPRGAGYVIEISNMQGSLPEGAANDPAHQIACASAINREMERLILQSPSQYLWGYHRYKKPRSASAGAA